MYESPRLERLGTFREITRMAGGCLAFADGVNPYHRYDGFGDKTCPLT